MSNRPQAVGAVVFAILIVTSLFAGTVTVSAATQSGNTATTQFASGSGTDGDPYVITDASQLQNMSTDLDAAYKLGNDIDASGIANFDPIGNSSSEFTGSFDGDGHTISNLTIDRPSTDGVGLFGYSGQPSTIENVTLTDVDITGDDRIGGLVGESNSNVTNVAFDGAVSGDDDVGGLVGEQESGSIRDASVSGVMNATDDRVGGLVGDFEGDLITGASATDLTVNGDDDRVGGLVGDLDTGLVDNSTVRNAVVNAADNDAGGLVAEIDDSSIVNSSVKNVTVLGDDDLGGLVGDVDNGSMVDSTVVDGSVNATKGDGFDIGGFAGVVVDGSIANASVTGVRVDGDGDTGGLVGQLGDGYVRAINGENVFFEEGGSITNASVNGTVMGEDDDVGGLVGFALNGSVHDSTAEMTVIGANKAGGLIGRLGENATVNRSYATGSVSGDASVGGLVGISEGSINTSYATGSVAGNSDVGGLVGNFSYTAGGSTIEGAYAAGAVTGNTDVGGLIGLDYGTGTVTDAYWDTETTGQASSPSGTGLTTVELKGSNATANTNLDFTANWDVVDTSTAISYPYLQSNTQEPAPGLESLAPFPGGFGTVEDPYQIGNWSQLDSVREYLDANYTLVNDLNETTADYDTYASATANGGAGWEPIGTAANPFTGSFDGDGHTISNLTIDRPNADDVGLFGRTSQTTTIKDITLDEVNVTGNKRVGALAGEFNGDKIVNASASGQVSGSGEVGGLVGTVAEGNITDSTASGAVHATVTYAGGLVGQIERGNVTDSTASGVVNADGDTAGGLVGEFITVGAAKTYSIANSSASGAVNTASNGGGLVGVTRNSIIENSSASGDTTVTDGKAGGLVAELLDGGDVVGSSATGDVSATESYVGGLVGRVASGGGAPPNITDSDASGEVTVTGGGGSTSAEYIGGLVGGVARGSVTDAHASGEVTLVAGSGTFAQVGGLIGNFGGSDLASSGFDGTLSNSSASGDVTGPQTVGGLVGVSAGTITDSHASGDVVGNGDGSLGPEGRAPKGNYTFGGLVGSATVGTIVNSSATGDVAAGRTVGGLVGGLGSFDGTATVVNSTAAGAVTGSKLIGGLAGSISQGSVSNSTALGSVTGTSTVGGLVGLNRDQITGSYAAGTVSGQDGVGGLVGSNSENVSDSYAAGTVSGQEGVGGLVGSNSGNVSDSYAAGAVSGSKIVGGALGLNSGNVTHAYAAGTVTGTDSVGGLVGTAELPQLQNTGTTIASYWDTETTGQETSAGSATGLTTSQLKGDAATTNTTLDFTTTWSVLDNGTHVSYPYLQANPQQPEPGLEQVVTPEPPASGGNDGSTGDNSDRNRSPRSNGDSNPRSTVSVTPITGAGNDQPNDEVSESAAADNGQPGEATDRQAVSVRNIGNGDVVAIVFTSTDGDEQPTEDEQPTSEGDGPTTTPETDSQTGEASQPSPRNVLPDGLDIRFKRGGDYDLEVSSRDIDVFDRAMDDPDAAATPDLSMDVLDDDSKRFVGETNQRPVGFIEVDTNFDSVDVVQEATHKFRVRKTYLEATGASVDTVRLYRDETDGWRSLPTRQVDEDETFYYFEADTPGFSVFAIGTSSPIFETGTASLDSVDETTGEVVATVPVENIGDEPGEFEATLTADGTTVATQTVTVGVNETAEVTVAGTLDTPGSATLQFAGQSIGTATYLSEESPVPEGADVDTTDDSADASAQVDSNEVATTDTDDEASSGLGVSGIGLSLFLVLGLLLLFIIWRRRDEEEEEDSETAL